MTRKSDHKWEVARASYRIEISARQPSDACQAPACSLPTLGLNAAQTLYWTAPFGTGSSPGPGPAELREGFGFERAAQLLQPARMRVFAVPSGRPNSAATC